MPKILVVDDDEPFRSMLADGLRKKGLEVSEARGGREALTAFDISKFDLVITDVVMPDGEGVELILKMRKLAPSLPIIVVSGGGDHFMIDYFAAMSRSLGTVAFLSKPFDLDRIQALVDRFSSRPASLAKNP